MIGAVYLRSLAKLWRHPPVGNLHVRVNPRFTAIVGRCVGSQGLIEISPVVARRNAKVQREILCHEAAHLVVWKRHGNRLHARLSFAAENRGGAPVTLPALTTFVLCVTFRNARNAGCLFGVALNAEQ